MNRGDDLMKAFFVVLCFIATGALLGYMLGRDYCMGLLARGLIYDESRHVPQNIVDGSAYGYPGALWGALISGSIGIGIQIWWHRTNKTPAF